MIGSRVGNDNELAKVKFPGEWVVVETEGLSYGSVPEYPFAVSLLALA